MTDFVYPSMRMDNKEKLHMVKVKDVASQIRGVTFAKSDVLKHAEKGYVPVLRAGNIEDATASVSWSDIVYIPTEKVRQVQFLRNNDVIIAASSGSLAAIGKCAQFESNDALCEDVSFGAFLKVLRLNAIDVDPQYFAHYFRTKEYRAIISHLASGANINNLRNQDIDNLEFYLPPLEEQRRIVEILDRADAIRAKRRQLLADYDELPRSLFLDMFGDMKADKQVLDVIEKIRTGPFGSDLHHDEFVGSGIAVLGLDNVVSNEFRWVQRRYITPEKYEKLKRYTVQPGAVLVSIMGTAGRCVVVPDNIPTAINTKHICAITVNREILEPVFLRAVFLWHQQARIHLLHSVKGSIMDGLNMGIIKKMPVITPPLSLQREFARRVEAIAAARAKVERALALDDELFASLQSRAFRGAL